MRLHLASIGRIANTMKRLLHRNVLLGVTGGIAAYKSADLIRRLKDEGANVRVVMTAGSEAFITPLTLQAVSGNPVRQHLLDSEAEAGMGHIELARWADVVVVAPASANFIARLSQGMADDLLTTLCLATASPIAIAPAMNRVMWENSVTRDNLDRLSARGIHQFGPGEGSQACGEVGEGRMLEPLALVELTARLFHTGELQGKRVLITAGPTRERLDPVRYLSNFSSGKMGYALARACAEAGAHVRLISGPTALDAPENVERMSVESAQEMLDAVLRDIVNTDLFIATAAVADYAPVRIAPQKLKKSQETLQLELRKTPDILATVGHLSPRPFVVGFAAETENMIVHAQDKLHRKRADVIIANDVSRSDIGFGGDQNEVTLVWSGGSKVYPAQSKLALATQLVGELAELMRQRK